MTERSVVIVQYTVFGLVCHGLQQDVCQVVSTTPLTPRSPPLLPMVRTTRTSQVLRKCLCLLLNPFFGVPGSIHGRGLMSKMLVSGSSGISLHSSRKYILVFISKRHSSKQSIVVLPSPMSIVRNPFPQPPFRIHSTYPLQPER